MSDSNTTSVAPPCDVALIGAGLSSTFTAIRLLEALLARPSRQPIGLVMVEQSGEFFAGVPYGRRSGVTSLIITPLNEFLPDGERARFVAWLLANRAQMVADLAARGGRRTAAWLRRALRAMDEGSTDELHLPRYLFGRYLAERAGLLLAAALSRGLVECTLVAGEVMRVERKGGGFELRIAAARGELRVASRLVVVGVGTPPTRKLFGGAESSATGALLVEDMYQPAIDETMERIAARVTEAGAGADLLLVGANAGSLEMLYHLSDVPEIEARAPIVHVLSPQGRLPERFHRLPSPAFAPQHLRALAAQPAVAASDILEAARLDIAEARRLRFGISDSLPAVSHAIEALLPLLSGTEKLAFATFPGAEIGRWQRRAGDEYSDVVDELLAQQRLDVIHGSFIRLAAGEGGAQVVYRDAQGGERTLPMPMAVVVNCGGSAGVTMPNQSRLLESLLRSGLFEPSVSGAGVRVNEQMEASDGLYVNGPLLSGNVLAGRPVWHVEHCGRILELSTALAARLLARLDEFRAGEAEPPADVPLPPARAAELPALHLVRDLR